MTSDRNRPGFGPAFWAGLAFAQPPYERVERDPPCGAGRPAPERGRGRVGRLLGAMVLWHRRVRRRPDTRMPHDIGPTRSERGLEERKPLRRA